MTVTFADQYNTCCITIDECDVELTADELIEACIDMDAIYYDGDDTLYVIQFLGRPQELYTKEAVIRTMKQMETK